MLVVTFQQIEGNVLPNIDPNELSTDQKYILDMCQAIRPLVLGNVAPIWATFTRANMPFSVVNNGQSDTSIVYLERKSRQTLGNTCKLHSKVYEPIWFEIKSKPSCTGGSRHLFHMIHYTRYLSTELNRIVDPVMQRNSYFAHPENLLIAMATDERPHIRPPALRRVLAARSSQNETDSTPRIFKVPLLNFEAQDYTE